MLTHSELVSLSHLLRDEKVLSVYIDGAVTDPGRRRVWLVELDRELRTIRRSLDGAPHDEREAFAECVTVLDEQLALLNGSTVRAPGWVAFIAGGVVHSATTVHAPTPTLARWETGIHLTPYVRALKQSRPVVVVVSDARTARVYRYQFGALSHEDTIRASVVTEPPSHMGNPPRPGFHGGTRGSTGEESAQRSQLAATERMMAEVAPRVLALAGSDGWIVVGGTARAAAQVARAVEPRARGRLLLHESLDAHASEAAVEAVARASASTLRDTADLGSVAEMIAVAHHARAALGKDATRYALEQACVRELYLTERFAREHDALAEQAVRSAFSQGASVDVVAREVAAQLDAQGGIGAWLRYVPPGPGAIDAVEADAATVDHSAPMPASAASAP
jgi:hypothetical protein